MIEFTNNDNINKLRKNFLKTIKLKLGPAGNVIYYSFSKAKYNEKNFNQAIDNFYRRIKLSAHFPPK